MENNKIINRANRIRVRLLLSLIAIISITSCNSFLNTEPYDSLNSETAITNYNSGFYALTGLYNTLQSTSYYGRDFVVFGDAPTDNIIVSPNNSNRFIAQAQWSMTPTNSDVLTFWAKAYQTIFQANMILSAVENIDATAIQKANIKAQALAIRALAHFDLVRYYAQSYSGNSNLLAIPYVTSTDNFLKPNRNTIEEVYTNIIADLQEAITNYNIVSQSSSDKSGMSGEGLFTTLTTPYAINSWAAKGVLAKVYMAQQNYSAASPILEDIIENSGYTILTNENYVAAWDLSYNNAKNVEFIFAIRNTADDYGATTCLGYIYIQSGYGDLRAPDSLIEQYSATDIRRQVLFTAGTGTQTEWTFVNKYAGRDGTLALSDIPVLRLSDIYLLYSEAEANLNNTTTAIEYLDKIRQRADSKATATPTTISKEALLDSIYLERRKELAYEGHYFFDQKRLQTDINGGYRSDNTLYTTIEYPSNLLTMPIPQGEIDANSNIEQNPGY